MTLLRSDNPHTRIMVASAFRGDVQSNGEGEERAAIAALLADWDQQREAATGMVKHLTQQFFRAEGAGAQALLDDVMTYEQDWTQRAVLDGLFETTRDAGFERAQLNQAHPLFAQDQLAIWPAIARARQGFTWAGDTLAAAAKPLNSAQQARMAQGATLYASSCANCHGADGAGVGAAGPPLKDSQWVTSAPERLVRIVLDGVSGPIDVLGETWNSAMPGHKNYPGFDDEGVAGLLTWLRRSWGHAGRAIEPEFVAAVRSETAARNALWTADELNAIDLNTHYRKYAGAYGAPGRAIQFTWDGKNLILDAGFIKGPLVEEKEDHFVYEPRAMRMEFVLSDSGTVKGVGMNMGDGINLLPKLPPAEPNP